MNPDDYDRRQQAQQQVNQRNAQAIADELKRVQTEHASLLRRLEKVERSIPQLQQEIQQLRQMMATRMGGGATVS